MNGAPFQDLVKHLVAKGVAITSTLTVFETFTPGRPSAPDRVLDAMLPEARDQYLRTFATIAGQSAVTLREALPQGDGDGAGLREGRWHTRGGDRPHRIRWGGSRLLQSARGRASWWRRGSRRSKAIKIATLNGATYLGRQDRIGSIAAGKQADLIVVNGDPTARIADVEKVEIVFKRGIGYDSEKIFAAVKGVVGQR